MVKGWLDRKSKKNVEKGWLQTKSKKTLDGKRMVTK